MKCSISGKFRSAATICCLTLCFSMLSVPTVSAADASSEKSTMYDLFSEWEENSAYPDWVASVSSTDGSMDHMTVIVISDEGEEELLSMLSDPENVQIFVDTQTYSYNSLLTVKDEIINDFMKDDPNIISCGLGWGTDENGNVIGFGESNSESRVIIEVLPEYVDEYTQKFTDLYQDMVYIEASAGADTDDAADLADNGVDSTVSTDSGSSENFLSSITSQINPISIIVFALGVFMMLVSIIITTTGRRKK